MPAPFTYELCGYRAVGKQPDVASTNPNMSDAGGEGSLELSRALLDALGVPPNKVAPANETAGNNLEEKVVEHLRSLRSDLIIERGRKAQEFAQYSHLKVFPDLEKAFKKLGKDFEPTIETLTGLIEGLEMDRATRTKVRRQIRKLTRIAEQQGSLVRNLVLQMPSESLLKIDISVAIPHQGKPDELAIALSSKWSLRTDRAQDCVSQGNKLVAQRRGHMPHFAVITIEPRPAMLRILGDGSGSVDFIYHLDVPALTEAIAAVDTTKQEHHKQGTAFNKLLFQGRLRDYDDLVKEVMTIPRVVDGD